MTDTGEPVPDFADLGLEAESRQRFEKAILKTGGLLLVTGPTGSGRTTTLYSALNHLNTPETKIVTIEGELPGVIQLRPVRSSGWISAQLFPPPSDIKQM